MTEVRISGRRVVASGSVVTGATDDTVTVVVPTYVKATFKFTSGAKAVKVNAAVDGDQMVFTIDDANDGLGFTYDVGVANDAGPDLHVTFYVRAFGGDEKTRFLAYSFSVLDE